MRTLVLAVVAVLALVLAGPAAAGRRGKIVRFHAVTTVHNTGGLNYAGSFTSSKLGNGTVKYANDDSGDEIHTTYTAKLKSGSPKGTATSMSMPGATPANPTTFIGAGKVAGGTRPYVGVKGKLRVDRREQPRRHAHAEPGTIELPVTK